MASLFISHSSRDNAVAARLVAHLKVQGYASLFLDFDPEDGIPAGRDWERELYFELRRCDAVIFLLSKASAVSRWCFAELALARSVHKPVFGIVVEKGATLSWLGDQQWIELTEENEPAALERLGRGLRLAGLDPRDSFSWSPDRPPYPGLQAFDAADAAVFFGREPEIDHLLSLLQPTLAQPARRSLGVVGGSGTGKSSLVRAGVLPRLGRRAERWSALTPVLPGSRPVASLARALAAALHEAGVEVGWRTLEAELREDPRAFVDRGHDLCLGLASRPTALLLCVDQLEELATRASVEEGEVFTGLLRAAATVDDSPWWWLATLRADFVTAKVGTVFLSDMLQQVVLLSPLSKERLSEAIERPAHRAGVEFEAGLVGRLIEDTVGGDAMPLLAYTLRRLYDRAREQGRAVITAGDYEETGGVTGSLRLQAEQVLARLADQHSRAEIVAALVRLAAVDDQDRVVGQPVACSRLDEKTRSILNAFIEARLVTSNQLEAETVVQVAHEALLRQWQPLREVLDTRRRELQLRRQIHRAASEWTRVGRTDLSYLVHRGSRLEEIERLLGHDGFLDPLEQAYVSACLAERRREQSEKDRSDRDMADALALRVWEGARALREESPLVAFHMMADAAGIARDPGLRAKIVRDQAPFLEGPALVAIGEEASADCAFSPDGTRFASCEGEHIRLRAADEGSDTGLELKLPGPAVGVRFNPSGTRLIGWTPSRHGLARLWDPRTGRRVGKDLRHASEFAGASFASASERLLTLDFDTLHLWDSQTGKKELEFKSRGKIQEAFLTPDGARVLLRTLGEVRLVLLDRGADVFAPLEGGGHFEGAELSSDGRRILTWNRVPCGDDLPFGSVKLWNAETGGLLQTVEHPTHRSQSAFFCDTGEHFGTCLDGTVTLWRASDGGKVTELRHDAGRLFGGIADVLPTRDGVFVVTLGSGKARTLVTASGDAFGPELLHTECSRGTFDRQEERLATWNAHAVLVWLAATGLRLGPEIYHAEPIEAVEFSPVGDRLLTRTREGPARLWKAPRSMALTKLLVHDRSGGTGGAAFSADGRFVLAWAGHAVLWKAATGERIGPPLTYLGFAGMGISGAAFSADGARVVTWGDVARVWGTDTADPVGPTLAHPGGAQGAAWADAEGTVITWGGNSLRRWDSVRGTERTAPQETATPIKGSRLAPNQTTLATVLGTKVVLWDLTAGPAVAAVVEPPEPVSGLCFDRRAQRLLVWPTVGSARLYNAKTGTPVGGELVHDGGWKRPPSFNDEGTRVVTWDGNLARVVEAETGDLVGEPIQFGEFIFGATLDSRGARLAVRGIDEVRVFAVDGGEPIGPAREHRGVNGLTFTRDGEFLLSWGRDHHARLWSVTTGHQIGLRMEHGASVEHAAFSPSENQVLTLELAGYPRLWELGDPGDPDLQAERLALRARVQTGAFFDPRDARVTPLSRTDWEKDRDAYRNHGQR